ncbi:MAG: recombinase family protein, partial [Selenomonadaceae bacterium]|nr:recombinase family protein [Selenomonadaceae bacterium]
MPEKVYRTAIYARLSKDDGDKAESNSIASQKALCEEYIANHSDLELVETFVDDGYSGVDFERPAFKKMENSLREGKIDAVIFNRPIRKQPIFNFHRLEYIRLQNMFPKRSSERQKY